MNFGPVLGISYIFVLDNYTYMTDRCFLVITFFIFTSVIFYSSCSKDEMDINTDYIRFYKEEPLSLQPLELNIQPKTKISQFVFASEVYTENLDLTTLFESLSDANLFISTGKTLGYINICNDRLQIYGAAKGLHDVELKEEEILPFTIKRGSFYSVGFQKTTDSLTFFLRNLTADNKIFQSFTKTYKVSTSPYQTLMWGKPFFTVLEGQIRIHNSWITTDYEKPTISIFGDSFIEGGFLMFNNVGLQHRWCAKLATMLGEDRCFIDGKGGEKMSDDFIRRFKIENAWYKSNYVILSLGTNNYSDIGEYKRCMQQALDIMRLNKQTPILVTVTPRPDHDYMTTAKLINDWVKKSGVRYIDMHKAVTQKDNPDKWIDGFVMYDGIHPGPQGYSAMYKQIQLDIPELFN